MNSTFTRAVTADIERLLAFMQEFYAHEQIEFNPRLARAALIGIIWDESLGRVWVIRVAGEAIGYAVVTLGYSLEFNGRDAILDELFLSEAHRGKGIGKAALAFVESACRALGANALHLVVERENTGAQAVYRQAGFIAQDRLLMTKRIALASDE
jgi:GNAT superfamily N-acetyltransferase